VAEIEGEELEAWAAWTLWKSCWMALRWSGRRWEMWVN
jgi:hypothetical protein